MIVLSLPPADLELFLWIFGLLNVLALTLMARLASRGVSLVGVMLLGLFFVVAIVIPLAALLLSPSYLGDVMSIRVLLPLIAFLITCIWCSRRYTTSERGL